MPASDYPGLSAVVGELKRIARARIPLESPEYAKTIEMLRKTPSTMDEFEGRLRAARPSGPNPTWYAPLGAALDVWATIDKVRLALQLLREHKTGNTHVDAAVGNYHHDAWVFHSHALCEKSNYLFDKLYKSVIVINLADSAERFVERTSALKDMRKEIGVVRNRLAHPEGFGIAGMDDERTWEVFALLDVPIEEVLRVGDDNSETRRRTAYEQFAEISVKLVGHLEEQLKRAAADLTSVER